MARAHRDATEAYQAGTDALRRAVAGMTAAQLRAKPVPGRWSTHEVICHLNDSEQAWCHRLKRVIAEDRPLLIGYDETHFAARLAYDRRDPDAEIELFAATRAQMALILSHVDEGDWSCQAVHSELGLLTLADMVSIETDHVHHHLKHVAEKRRSLGLEDGD